MIDFVEIEIDFTCRTKIHRRFKWLGGLATKPAMATFTCIGFMPETWPNRSKCRRCDWLWIFENRMQTKRWGNLRNRSHCVRLFNYADILLHQGTTQLQYRVFILSPAPHFFSRKLNSNACWNNCYCPCFRHPVVKLNGEHFIINATIFDLDPKLYPRHFTKYVQKTRDSFNAYKCYSGAKTL